MRRLIFTLLIASSPAAAAFAQSDAPVGVRATGMGGAFVAVADDASAVFWNPAGLASGSYFSLVIDWNALETASDVPAPRDRSAQLVAVGTPPLGVSYYRTHAVIGGVGGRVESLIAHNTCVTLVQSLTQGIAVGAPLK